MELPFKLNQKIVESLISIPNMHDKKRRSTLILSTGLDKDLEAQIVYEGDSIVFFQSLVRTLVDYGKLKDGRNALEAVLEAAKPLVGSEGKENCNTLIQAWRQCVQEASAKEGIQSKQPDVSDYTYDILVSHATADKDWLTTLISILERRLTKSLGGEGTFSLWKSHKKSFLTDEIIQKIKQTAILVIILSDAYLDSKKCDSERNTFLKHISQQQNPYNRVFVVELGKIEDHERLQELNKFSNRCRLTRTLGRAEPNPEDPQYDSYYAQVNDLIRKLADELKLLKSSAESPNIKDDTPDTRPAIFLAEVADDLIEEREEVRRYVEQAGFRVLPDVLDLGEPMAFQREVEVMLEKCTIFVQLLSDLPGRKHPGWTSYISLQYECARKSQKSILQWCSSSLNVEMISDIEHRKLLEGKNVLAGSLEEFKQNVVKQVKFETLFKLDPTGAFVFINAHSEDYPLAEGISRVMEKYAVASALPQKQTDILKELEQYILFCDGIIIVYGNVNVLWVKEHVISCNRMLYRREDPLKTRLALFEGPPEEKEDLNVNIPGMYIIKCREGIDEEEFEPFLQTFRKGESS